MLNKFKPGLQRPTQPGPDRAMLVGTKSQALAMAANKEKLDSTFGTIR